MNILENLDRLYEVDAGGNAVYYHYDATGSTTALTDASETVTDRMEYAPYGTLTHREGTHDTPFLWTGLYGNQTDANGLVHMRARAYNPLTRRFLNADPAREGWNWYAYAGGDPVGSVDPSGLALEDALHAAEFSLQFLGLASTGVPAVDAQLAQGPQPSLLDRIGNWLDRVYGNQPRAFQPGSSVNLIPNGNPPDLTPDTITLGLGLGLKAKQVKNGILSFDVGASVDFSKTVSVDNYFDQITKAQASVGAYLNMGPFESGGYTEAFATQTAWGPTTYGTGGDWSGFRYNSNWSSANIKFNEFEGTLLIFKFGISWDD